MRWLCSGVIVLIKSKVLEFGRSVNRPWGFISKADTKLLFPQYPIHSIGKLILLFCARGH